MNSNLNLKDTRVPTFIHFEADSNMENNDKITTPKDKKASTTTTKRKRVAATENTKPAKRKAGKKLSASTTEKNGNANALTQPSEQVWVGAAITEKDNMGAYAVYYGENDQRNLIETFKRENELQDLDYAYVLGTLKAILKAANNTTLPLTVNTTCRDLIKAITATRRGGGLHYQDIVDTIRDLIKEKNNPGFQVRHVSGRSSSSEQKAAIKLATLALEELNQTKEKEEQEKIEEKEEEKVIEEEKIVQETTISTTDKTNELPIETQELVEKALSASTTETDKLEEQVEEEEKIEQVTTGPLVLSEATEVDQLNIAEGQEKEETITTTTITTEQVTTTVETKVEITINKPTQEEDVNMEEVVEEEEPPKTAALSWFGNLLDVLYAPFRGGRNNNNRT